MVLTVGREGGANSSLITDMLEYIVLEWMGLCGNCFGRKMEVTEAEDLCSVISHADLCPMNINASSLLHTHSLFTGPNLQFPDPRFSADDLVIVPITDLTLPIK